MHLTLTQYFLLFMIYACLGWLLEVIGKLIEYKKFINRGFLIGPYCPIYGWGAVAITLLLYRYAYDPFVLFIMTIITCATLEYVTSWVMEKLFKARWWDYSKRKFNLDGRVCLETTIPFGLMGMFIIYVSNPFIIEQFDKIDSNILNRIAIILFLLYLLDNIISGVVIYGFGKTTVQVSKEGRQDNTEEITKKVREILSSKSWTYKRLINAYPKLVAIKYKIKEIQKGVKENAKEVKNNINEKAQDVRNIINDKKEEVKNTLNEKKEEMKNSLIDTGNDVLDEINARKRKASVSLKLSKRKWKRNFSGKKESKF